MSRRPPYQLVADVGSVLLVVFIILAYRFFPAQVPGWAFRLAYVVAGLVLLGVGTELYLFWRDYRAGVLFPMRNASLFILLLSLVGLPLYLVYLFASGQDPGPSTLLLVPVLLAFATRNLFRVRIDELSVRAKTGFRAPIEVLLFQLEEVAVGEDRITITSATQRPIYLLRAFFFRRHWAGLVEKLKEISQNTSH